MCERENGLDSHTLSKLDIFLDIYEFPIRFFFNVIGSF